MREWIGGRNPVYEVLRAARRQPFRLLIAQGAQENERLGEILVWCTSRNLPVEQVPRHRLDAILSGHQGMALEVSAYPYSTLQDILELSTRRGEAPFILILDTLQDPQNLGALLRTAEAVGIHGVLLPLRRAARVTPAVVNVSSGATEHLLIARVNLAQAIQALKTAGVWVIGLESRPQPRTGQIRLDGALALVVGNEASGMRSLVRTSCDAFLRLPMRGRVASLNAAVAGSVALYQVWQARQFLGASG